MTTRDGNRAGRPRNAARYVDTLTKRELEVLQGLADGHTNFSLAAHLRISEETVKSHVRHILWKLDCAGRAHAVALGFRKNLVS